MKQFFFMSGLPRAGSTLLGSILNQNPNIHVSPTSPLFDYLFFSEQILQNLTTQYTYNLSKVSSNIHKGSFENFYKHVDKPIIIDKHRAWVKNIDSIKNLLNINSKIICTYRPFAEIVTSYINLANNDSNNIVDNYLKKNNLPVTTENRSNYIFENWVLEMYESSIYALKHHKKNLLLVSYEEIANQTKETLNKIYDFLEIEKYNHNLSYVENTCAEEKDEAWGFKGLHDIRNTISKQSLKPEYVLTEKQIQFYNTYDKFLKELI